MKNWNAKIQSWYLKVKDNWGFVIILIILNLSLPAFLRNLNIARVSKFFNLLGYKIPIWSLLLSIILSMVLYKIYKKIKNKGGLSILKATYGIGSSVLDITDKLKDSIIDNKLKIVLSNNISGDPVPGQVKKATIQYKLGGSQMTKEYIENDVIDIP